MKYQIIKIVGGLDGEESLFAEFSDEQAARSAMADIESTPDVFVLNGKPCRYRLDIV